MKWLKDYLILQKEIQSYQIKSVKWSDLSLLRMGKVTHSTTCIKRAHFMYNQVLNSLSLFCIGHWVISSLQSLKGYGTINFSFLITTGK